MLWGGIGDQYNSHHYTWLLLKRPIINNGSSAFCWFSEIHCAWQVWHQGLGLRPFLISYRLPRDVIFLMSIGSGSLREILRWIANVSSPLRWWDDVHDLGISCFNELMLGKNSRQSRSTQVIVCNMRLIIINAKHNYAHNFTLITVHNLWAQYPLITSA